MRDRARRGVPVPGCLSELGLNKPAGTAQGKRGSVEMLEPTYPFGIADARLQGDGGRRPCRADWKDILEVVDTCGLSRW